MTMSRRHAMMSASRARCLSVKSEQNGIPDGPVASFKIIPNLPKSCHCEHKRPLFTLPRAFPLGDSSSHLPPLPPLHRVTRVTSVCARRGARLLAVFRLRFDTPEKEKAKKRSGVSPTACESLNFPPGALAFPPPFCVHK